MEQQLNFVDPERKTQKNIWLKLLVISSVIFIPIILIGHLQTKAGCYAQGWACFPSFLLIISLLLYGLSIMSSIVLGITEFAKNKSPEATVSSRENSTLLRMFSFLVFATLYRFIVHIEMLIDYSRVGFKWESSVLQLPFEIIILITLFFFAIIIARNWNNYLVNNKSLLLSCVILALASIIISLIDIRLMFV